MSQSHTLGRVATTISQDGGFTRVVYHHTTIVRWNAKSIVLNSGGWHTHTTKHRMNQASNQFSLDYRVFQKDHDWFVIFKGQTIPFNDQMELTR